MIRFSLFALLAVLTSCASGPAGPSNLFIAHCLQGCPAGTPATNEIIVRHLFAVSINAGTRMADWVSYRVVPEGIGVASLLPRDWRNDELTRNGYRVADLEGEGNALVQPGSPDQADGAYRVTEFRIEAGEQGRLVPMTSFAGTSYWSDLNLLTVMSLMKSDMRLASWARLDQAINRLVAETSELYVVAGPVYDANPSDAAGSYAPTAFYKVVANPDGKVAAFLFDQALPVHAAYCDQASSLERIQSLTGLQLFPAATDWPQESLLSALGCAD